MSYIESFMRARDVFPRNESLENHREEIWNAIEYMLHNEAWKGKLKPYLFNGELVISPARTVASLVEAVNTAIVNGPVVQGDFIKLGNMPCSFPLDAINAFSTEDKKTTIMLDFRNPLRKNQVHQFIIVFDENGSVNVEESWEGCRFEST